MINELERMRKDPAVSRDKIDDDIIAFGKEIWPYRKAFWHVHDEAKLEEQQYIREKLNPTLREKYEQFLRKGGRIEDIRKEAQLLDLETYFTPDELGGLVEAKLSAHDRVVSEVDSLCAGEKKQVCTNALAGYIEEQKKIEEFINQLRTLGESSLKWKSEILDKVRTFEAGWSGLEKEMAAQDMKGEIDYYLGVITAIE